ncbi:MAG: hypothetical protein R3194_10080, partial [Limnobacter sp.]|nr:hypothetical protein [Limnobacter sp.]
MDKLAAGFSASRSSSPNHFSSSHSSPAIGPMPPLRATATQLGDEFFAQEGAIRPGLAQAVVAPKAMSLVECHDALAREPSTQQMLAPHFESYVKTVQQNPVHFFCEQAGFPVLDQMDTQSKAATLIISEVCTGSTQPKGRANAQGLDNLRAAFRRLHPTVTSTDIDSIIIHYALNLGGVVSNEGWMIQEDPSRSAQAMNMVGPAASALLDATEKFHCLRTLLEQGAVYADSELPERASVLVGTKDLPNLLTQAVFQGDSASVDLLLKHG